MGNTTGIMADAIAPPVKVYIVWNDYALKKPDTYTEIIEIGPGENLVEKEVSPGIFKYYRDTESDVIPRDYEKKTHITYEELREELNTARVPIGCLASHFRS